MRFHSSGISVGSIAVGALCLLLASPATAAEPSGAMSQLHVSSGEHLQFRGTAVTSIAPAADSASILLAEGVQSIATQNQCLTYSYDKNGNRQTESALIFGTAPVWGAAPYGCFTWTQP